MSATESQTELKPAALCAKNDIAAAAMLGIGTTKLWELCNLPKNDPRRIKRTSYGKIPISELERHIREEMNSAEKAEAV